MDCLTMFFKIVFKIKNKKQFLKTSFRKHGKMGSKLTTQTKNITIDF